MDDEAAPDDFSGHRPVEAVRSRPVSVTVAAGVAALEALGLAAYAISYLVVAPPFRDNVTTRVAITAGVVLFLLLAAGAVAAAARALFALRHWPRSLLVVVQLITVAVMLPLALAGAWFGWVGVAVAVVVVVLVLAPATTAAIEDGGSDPGLVL